MNVFRSSCLRAARQCLPALGIGLLLLGIVASTARAQFEFDSSMRQNRFNVVQMLSNRQIPPGQEQVFDDYFNKYALLLMVQPAARADLPKARTDLRSYFSRKSGAAHDRLNQLALAKMKAILASPSKTFDTPIKVNAMLVVGDLNEQEADAGVRARPLSAALPVLFAPFAKPKIFSDPVRVAALVGLVRHAESGAMPANYRPRVIKEMVALIEQDKPPAPRSAEGHAWLQMLAAQVLGGLGDPAGGTVPNALVKGLADPDGYNYSRREMVRALGMLKFPAGSKTDFTRLANEVGHFASDICEHEIIRGHAEADQVKKTGYPHAADVPSLRFLKQHLHVARQALSGSDGNGGLRAASTGTPHQSTVDRIAKAVQTLAKSVDEADVVGAELTPQLEEDRAGLAKSLKPRAVERKVAEDGQGAAATDEQLRARTETEPAAAGATR